MGYKSRPLGYFNVKACYNKKYLDCVNRGVIETFERGSYPGEITIEYDYCKECVMVQGKPTEYRKPGENENTK